MSHMSRAADLQSALLRTAVGDNTSEAAVLLLAHTGYWLPALAAADLIAAETDDHNASPTGQVSGRDWAVIAWTKLESAMATGRIEGSSGQLRILRAAASIAVGRSVDLGDTASGLDRRHLELLLAAMSHAGGSHEHRGIDGDGIPGDPLPPLVPWPARH